MGQTVDGGPVSGGISLNVPNFADTRDRGERWTEGQYKSKH